MESRNLKDYPLLIVITLGFVSGVSLGSLVSISPAFSLVPFIIGLGLILFLFFSPTSIVIFVTSAFLLSLGAGILRYSLSEPLHQSVLSQFIGVTQNFEGVVVAEPDERESSTLLIIEMERAGTLTANERVLVSTERHPQFKYGDLLSIKGVLKQPQSFETESGVMFNYPSYLAKDDIYFTMFRPDIDLIGGGGGNPVVSTLLSIKGVFLTSAGRYIPEPENALLGGLLLGAKHGLPENTQESLRRAGLIHIIVLSGYNITIVANAIMGLLGFLGLYARLSVGAGAIILFAIMTGGSSTVVRASVMALLVLLAQATGRTHEITRVLIIAGIAMILWNPKILLFDPSFQLSFLATIGLIHLSPFIEKRLRFAPTVFQIREVVVATIATQILVTPLLLHMTGQFSIVSLLSNVLILPLIPLTMLFGFLAGTLGLLHQALSLPFAYIAYALLHFELVISEFLGNLTWATVSSPAIPGFIVALFYGVTLITLLSRGVFRPRSN